MHLLGIYPVGTCVILDPFEVGIVAAPDPDGQQLNRPLVRVAVEADGGTVPPPGRLVSLTEPAETAGFRRIVVTEPGHPYVANWWPAGHGLGYEHGFTHQVVDLLTAIAKGEDPTPSFADGLQVQRVLDAVERSSAADSVWTRI